MKSRILLKSWRRQTEEINEPRCTGGKSWKLLEMVCFPKLLGFRFT